MPSLSLKHFDQIGLFEMSSIHILVIPDSKNFLPTDS